MWLPAAEEGEEAGQEGSQGTAEEEQVAEGVTGKAGDACSPAFSIRAPGMARHCLGERILPDEFLAVPSFDCPTSLKDVDAVGVLDRE
jgi:hypothetical protein